MKFKIRINSCLLQFFDFNPKQYKSQKKLLEISLLLIQSSIRAKKKKFFTLNQSSISAKKLTKIVQTQLRWAWHNLGQHSCTQDVNAHKSKLIGLRFASPNMAASRRESLDLYSYLYAYEYLYINLLRLTFFLMWNK